MYDFEDLETPHWQMASIVTSAILGEVIHALGIDEKIDWDSIRRDAAEMTGVDERNLIIEDAIARVRAQVREAGGEPPF